MSTQQQQTGCYPGCFYYSDSCFRQDCKKTPAMAIPSTAQPPLRAVQMGLFPTLGSLQEVVDFSKSKLPITSENEMFSLLMIYHNTLLSITKQ